MTFWYKSLKFLKPCKRLGTCLTNFTLEIHGSKVRKLFVLKLNYLLIEMSVVVVYLLWGVFIRLIHLQTCIDMIKPFNIFYWCERMLKSCIGDRAVKLLVLCWYPLLRILDIMESMNESLESARMRDCATPI